MYYIIWLEITLKYAILLQVSIVIFSLEQGRQMEPSLNSVHHFQPNSQEHTAELNAALCLETRTNKCKY